MQASANTGKSINWGGVVKGVAVITVAVVAVAAVAYFATQGAAFLGAGAASDSLIGNAGQQIMNGWDALSSGAGSVWDWVTREAGYFKNWLTGFIAPAGGAGAFTAAAKATSTHSAIGAVAGMATAAASVPLVSHTISNIDFVHHAHHAAEASTERRHPRPASAGVAAGGDRGGLFSERVARKAPAEGGFSNRADITKPSASKVNAELVRKTAELDEALKR